jgi:hypothetical protein
MSGVLGCDAYSATEAEREHKETAKRRRIIRSRFIEMFSETGPVEIMRDDLAIGLCWRRRLLCIRLAVDPHVTIGSG